MACGRPADGLQAHPPAHVHGRLHGRALPYRPDRCHVLRLLPDVSGPAGGCHDSRPVQVSGQCGTVAVLSLID